MAEGSCVVLTWRRMASAALLRKHGAKPTSQSAAELDQAQFGSDEEAQGSDEEAQGSDEEASGCGEEGDGSDEGVDEGDISSEEDAQQGPAGKEGRGRAKPVGRGLLEADAEVPGAVEAVPPGSGAVHVAASQVSTSRGPNQYPSAISRSPVCVVQTWAGHHEAGV